MSKSPQPITGVRTKADFRFADTRLCFSLTATLGDRGRKTPYERLNTPDDLARWCRESGLLSEPPKVDRAALERTRAMREAIQRVGEAFVGKQLPRSGDIDLLNRTAAYPPPIPRIDHESGGVLRIGKTVDAVLSAIARDMIELAASPAREHLRICENPGCRGVYADESRSGTRRWCSMKTCGALVKKRNYRARKRDEVA